MGKTLAAVVVLFFAVFFLPFWIQVVLFVLSILLVPHRVFLLVPALFADAWYAPVRSISLNNNKTTLFVLGLIIIYTIIIRTTRVSQKYGLEKE